MIASASPASLAGRGWPALLAPTAIAVVAALFHRIRPAPMTITATVVPRTAPVVRDPRATAPLPAVVGLPMPLRLP